MDTETALEIQIPLPVLSWCFTMKQINEFYLMFLYATYKCI